jgi:Ser/Thr protein kinase RdoA (MazF antagonist)
LHGDIRDTNIMFDLEQDRPFRLLDFDWAARGVKGR